MESLETIAEVRRSAEDPGRNAAPRIKCSSCEPQTEGAPPLESEGGGPLESEGGGRGLRQPLEGQSGSTCGGRETTDSGNSQQLGDQCSRARLLAAAGHKDYDPSTYPSLGRQETVGHHRKSPGLGPDASVQQPCSHPGTDPSAVDAAIKVDALKSQKPGRYVCDYCGRACAKPSVLKKHIRSHTGERPYPCLPCGFSFKTKSNLYKHRKSHAHLVKAGSGSFSELGPYGTGMDQGSFEGEAELYSDGDQTTDTDDDGDSLLLLDSPAEAGSDSMAVKVLNLIAQKKGGGSSTVAQEVSPHLQEVTAAPSPPSLPPSGRTVQSSAVKQRLALRLSEKRSSESEQNLSLPSQSSKGSTDSGYFSRSESAEHQAGPPNTNAKSYQEIMFGKCYRPSPKQMTAFAILGSQDASSENLPTTTARSERGVSRVFTQEKDVVDSIKINTKTYAREEMEEGAQPEGGSDTGPLLRSNSMPTSSAIGLAVPPCLRGSHSFDERSATGGLRRLRRQAAFEHSVQEGHADADGKVPEGRAECGMEGTMSGASHQRHAMELATRKRRKEKREEEDASGLYDTHGEECDEIARFPDSIKDYDMKGAMGLLALGKGVCLHAQMDRGDMELSVDAQTSGRKAVGNVISVIQHTNSLNRPHAPEPPESYVKYQGPRQEHIPSYHASLEHTESCEMESSISGHGQSFQMGPKLVRQSNIQVPEIRVTVEPDSPEKAPEVKAKEPERQVEVEFQWPQRSETLAQFPPEKLPPKKKRLRLADIEHSSGESSFESACTSLSRSPSQDSNLSYSSAFSFDREESLKSLSPARQDEFGRPLELLAVPGSGHALSLLHQRQQHEMRRSASEQAHPCDLRKEIPEVRSVSFDYGSLTPASKLRLADISTGPSAARERRRGNLVRQESLNMDTELTQQLVPSKIIPQFPGSVHPFAPTALLPPTLPIFATGTYQSPPSMMVPVRVHTHLPNYGSITYTTVSQILDYQCDTMDLLSASSTAASSHHQLRLFGHLDPTVVVVGDGRLALNVDALDLSSAKLKTGIPLSLTSRTISTTNASSGGTNKRMLSPASSLDLFIEVKQQKRVKEEKMFGQIVEELSAVELGKCNLAEDNRQGSEMQVFCVARGREERSQQSKFISSLRRSAPEIISDSMDSAMDSSASERSTPPYTAATPPGEVDVDSCGEDTKMPMDTAHDSQPAARRDALISDDLRQLRLRPSSQFPSLRTTTGVSWCFLNYTKPSDSVTHCVGGGGGGDKAAPVPSVYATWCVSLHNPNPPEVSTSTALALLRSGQRQGGGEALYTMAAMCQPGAGKLVSSLILWRQKMEQLQRKPEIKEEVVVAAVGPAAGVGPTGPTGAGPTAVAAYGKKAKDTGCRPRTAKEEWKEREATLSQALPNRIKIFEGGYKSNEDYVYVRGRGRGKYICEECGIRCKKPSMLKKHIRTHTDVRPYVCRVCNFAFKTKGNLTKHMKSKAHMKKCLEMGVSVSVDDIDIQEVEGGAQQESGKSGPAVGVAKHQFSDADDSDGMDEDIDEIDEDEDDEEDYDGGESTPRHRSRSSSPQLAGGGGVASLAVTAASVAALHGCSLAALPRAASKDNPALAAMERRDRHVDEDSLTMLSPDQSCFLFDPSTSCLLSPGWESPLREPSPSRLRYPSPRRELSPRGRSSSSSCSSPRWDGSPLRPASPGGFSSASPSGSQHLSPVSAERPLSPLSELGAGRREPAVRGRQQRVVLRAMSPRRGAHQHRGPAGDMGRPMKVEAPPQLLTPQHHPPPGAFDKVLDQRGGLAPSMPCGASALQPNLLSHLPLHSQQPTRSLLPLRPIGGLQTLHAQPSSSSSSSSSTCTSSSSSSCTSSALSPQASESSMECGSLPEVPETGGGGEEVGGVLHHHHHHHHHQERLSSSSSSISSSPASCSSVASPPEATTRRSAEEPEEERQHPGRLDPGGGGGGGGGVDSGQEENVRTCVTAIASLKISTEDLH